MVKTFQLEVAGLTRHLPICRLNDEISIAGFIMFSDVELTIACAKELLAKAPDFEVILTAEAKGIPLAYEMARQSGKNYVVVRKMSKLYMSNPIEVEVQSITTARKQTLFLDGHELKYLEGKDILIVDDVISTGGSLDGMEKIVEIAHGNIAGKATVLAEGIAAERDDIIFLQELPLLSTPEVESASYKSST